MCVSTSGFIETMRVVCFMGDIVLHIKKNEGKHQVVG